MPKIQKNFELSVSPQQFIDACNDMEIQELDLLMNSPGVRDRISKLNEEPPNSRNINLNEHIPQIEESE